MIPNKTYELRKLYFEQSQYSLDSREDKYNRPPILQWPTNSYFDRFKDDSELFEKALIPEKPYSQENISHQIFGNEIKNQYTGLKHIAHLLYERSKLHKNHINEISDRHLHIQGIKFGVEINHTPDRAKRLSNIESQLLQLEQSRRDEELNFWKDTVELREKLFAGASEFSSAKQRYSMLSGLEDHYGQRI
ncbi:MAG: hypothetical protein A2Y10_08370 [Planctomycetes bacterium GWF2_41_51]|nr:MAG: hypothetical protein A2Y10_08370 [Planctomycetes bacterium GWF2_41_51]HBG25835.1 hypothetical protein [Phycisphaerales bacterium]